MQLRFLSILSGLAVVSLLASLTACSSDDKNNDGNNNTDSSSGQALYTTNCSSCHGSKGEGGIGANITGSTSAGIGSWTAAQFMSAVRDGKDDEGVQLCATMPKFPASQLSDAQVTSIHDYLLSQMNDTAHDGTCD
jgi:mono/diheme cytochrome c family protein